MSKMVRKKENIIMIDNYDSFTYNVVEYLMSLGVEDVPTYRNDQITLPELIKLNPTKLVISPGPGHPLTDAGISSAAISHFAGKIPVLGVCMGLQCIFTAFGGVVSFAGEIVHGKTSVVEHDGKGLYKGVPQGISVTRYHSLSGTYESVPAELEITSWTVKDGQAGERGVLMGVRHREFIVEGVQYHPESILSEEGKAMLQNFLDFQGGTWVENERYHNSLSSANSTGSGVHSNGSNSGAKSTSILDTIHAQRLLDIAASKSTPGTRQKDLQMKLFHHLSPPQISFVDRLAEAPGRVALMAEIKRASPSKGDIDITADAPAQALRYAHAGASVISVLTEPKWFKGNLEDLRSVRQVIDAMPNRPAILRKDFIVDEYQILEARVAGADTILLIVAMLSESRLRILYEYSQSLGMEPLVEVNNADEMKIAASLRARVIGVNNRNLHTFGVDLNTTSKLVEMVPRGTILAALSGISNAGDVEKYVGEGVKAVLVGESLMRAKDTKAFTADLLGLPKTVEKKPSKVFVKVCGMRSVEAALAAAEEGADLIGMIFAKERTRTIQVSKGISIAQAIRSRYPLFKSETESLPNDWFQYQFEKLRRSQRKPAVVGVFLNTPLEEILEVHDRIGFDYIQLHGQEALDLPRFLPVPVIRALPVSSPYIFQAGLHAISLIDTGTVTVEGGSGKSVDWARLRAINSNGEKGVFLAGGLTPENVAEAIQATGVWGVDVSSGVEDELGNQNIEKIRLFVRNAKK